MSIARRSIVLLLLTVSLLTQGIAVAMGACLCPEMPAEMSSVSHDHHQHASVSGEHACCHDQDQSSDADYGIDFSACDQCDCHLVSTAGVLSSVSSIDALPADVISTVTLASHSSSSPYVPFRPPIL